MISKPYTFVLILVISQVLFSCESIDKKNVQAETQPKEHVIEEKIEEEVAEPLPQIQYQILSNKDWKNMQDSIADIPEAIKIISAINRTDENYIRGLDSLVLPSRYDLDLNDYLSFPKEVELLHEVRKVIIFHQVFQIFAAYEYGQLVLQGQTNTGKKSTPTPPKLYATNWKAKRSVSSVNGSWILNWNFNISNFEGIGFHQYDLPGAPASHSCLRLTNDDAYFLYNWADQWILSKNDQLLAHGTPVIVHGQYAFDEPKPWNQLVKNEQALILNQDSMRIMIEPHLETILERQKKREEVTAPTV